MEDLNTTETQTKSSVQEKQTDASSTDTQRFLKFGDRQIILVGTAHVSAESMHEVTDAIEANKPDCVAIELDDKRYASLTDPEAWKKMDIVKVLKNKQGFLMMGNLVLSSYQKRMGAETGVQPGDEMLAAINKAKEMNIPTSMVDRPIAVTLRRAWSENSFFGKCKLLSALIATAFSKEEVGEKKIEELKKNSEMDNMMTELADYMPAVKRVLIDERDFYLASHIWESKGDKVLAVLGAGHLNGVAAHLKKMADGEEKTDCSAIDHVAPKSVGSKIAGWIIPVLIVALIVAGFVWGGAKNGTKMITGWVLWNGILAALGTILAGGHPLTILVAFVGAPFTSLCPFIGVGVLTGIVQALIVKPKVEDMETMQADSNSFKGFYKNRILRVLLVFLFSSIGSSIGTFVAGASFVKTISQFFDRIVMSVKEWCVSLGQMVKGWFVK